jgi:hypothetical protein
MFATLRRCWALFSRGRSAVDGERRANHESRFVAEQVRDQSRDLIRRGMPRGLRGTSNDLLDMEELVREH